LARSNYSFCFGDIDRGALFCVCYWGICVGVSVRKGVGMMRELDEEGIATWGVRPGDRVETMAVDFGELSVPAQQGTVVGFQQTPLGLGVLIRADETCVVQIHTLRSFRKVEAE
jgi:hypothetical protein